MTESPLTVGHEQVRVYHSALLTSRIRQVVDKAGAPIQDTLGPVDVYRPCRHPVLTHGEASSVHEALYQYQQSSQKDI